MYFNKPSTEAMRYLLMGEEEFRRLPRKELSKAISVLDEEKRTMFGMASWGEAYAAEDVTKVKQLFSLALSLVD